MQKYENTVKTTRIKSNLGEDVVPDGSFVLLVGTGASSVDGEDAGVGHLDGFEIMDELDFLVEDLVGDITMEQLLCVHGISLISKKKTKKEREKVDVRTN